MKAVNLLPPDLRGGPKRGKGAQRPKPEPTGGPGPFIVLGALALSVLGLAVYVLAGNAVSDREAQLAQVTSESQVVARQVAALKPYADFDALATKRVETVKALAATRFDWEQALRDLAHAVPQEVTLSKLEATVSASGGSSLRTAINAPAIELTGCTTGQQGVSRLLNRLRTVRGVTRTSLVKSESSVVDETGKPKTAEEARSRQAQAPCGTGRRPTFQVVAFFERSADLSAAADASASGSTAAATATPGASATATATATPAGAVSAAKGAAAATNAQTSKGAAG